MLRFLLHCYTFRKYNLSINRRLLQRNGYTYTDRHAQITQNTAENKTQRQSGYKIQKHSPHFSTRNKITTKHYLFHDRAESQGAWFYYGFHRTNGPSGVSRDVGPFLIWLHELICMASAFVTMISQQVLISNE